MMRWSIPCRLQVKGSSQRSRLDQVEDMVRWLLNEVPEGHPCEARPVQRQMVLSFISGLQYDAPAGLPCAQRALLKELVLV
mmetsp:Transcript_60937/g.115141  ORF Transcript_60937/g.115141 Transcript_60937/m.115141 type:complete len:81 (-) Transcript_60937:25-267(-)